IPEGIDINDEIDVFVYRDSEDRLIATTLEPRIQLNGFASLRVKDVNDFGAFLDWGLEKDLMVPYREQTTRMRVGQYQIVYLYVDETTGRLAATNKLDRFLEDESEDLKEGQQVDLLVWTETDLGYNVVINQRYKGLLYKNQIFSVVEPGDEVTGYIKYVREDKKIDVSLQQQGFANIEVNAQVVLDRLKKNNGFLALTDDSSPEEIMDELQMSKKTFKKAIGTLYKQKLIVLEDKGISLLS
ncbi:MAG: GntR family transcriptional regulator, partial [Cytophagaceae bacterium]|nr:GntR family transcriptional regulator [Cytophagaceae bacterium]